MTPRAVTASAAVTGGPTLPPTQAAHRIVTGMHGVDIHPMTAAVARLRLTVYLAHLLNPAGPHAAPARLTDIPAHLTPHIAVGDALLLGQIDRAAYARAHPHLAELPGAAFPRDDFDWPTTGT